MDSRNLSKALAIYAKLMTGEEISSKHRDNSPLYEDYTQNAEVYEIVQQILKELNLSLYEYKEALYLTAGDGNRVFGYSNDELKRLMGLRTNKELYLVYYCIYQILLAFYSDSAAYQYREYIRLEEIVSLVTESLRTITADFTVYTMDKTEESSFTAVGLLWDELPTVTGEDREMLRASKASRMGIVKLTCNFLVAQHLFAEMNERYYPTDRFRAIVELYFEENRGRIYELLEGGQTDAEH